MQLQREMWFFPELEHKFHKKQNQIFLDIKNQ